MKLMKDMKEQDKNVSKNQLSSSPSGRGQVEPPTDSKSFLFMLFMAFMVT